VRRVRRRLAIAVVVALAVAAPIARPVRADDAAQDAKLAEAQELFRRGVALSEAEAYDRALDFFLRSRALVPSGGNTINAASCLEKLGRYDEALEMAEEVVSKFLANIDPHNRAIIGPMMAELRKKVGSLAVSSDVDATLFVDGRGRGKVPLASPLRLLAGRHVVRVVKPGFSPHEQTIVSVPGVLVTIEARLQMIPGTGVLRVEDPSLEGANVFVDGARVGTVPWEATIAAGPHVVRTEGGDRGSAPTEILVVQGQTSLARPASRELGAVLNLSVDPLTATLSIDGVFVARGRWMGRLPKGPHELTAAEPGYKTRRATVNDGLAPPVRRLTLRVDPNDPHWPHASPGRFVASAFASIPFTGSLHGGAAAHVPSDSTYFGPAVGAHLGFRLPIGIAPELTVGYLSVTGSLRRTESTSFTVRRQTEFPIYHLRDSLWFRGPLGMVGASLSRDLGRLHLIARGGAGIMYARSSDPVQGFIASRDVKPPVLSCNTGTRGCESVNIDHDREVLASFPPFFLSELGIAYPFKSFDVGVAFAGAIFPEPGRRFLDRHMLVNEHCSKPSSLGCVPLSSAIARDRSYGPFLVWLPQAFVAFPF
jgi:PEGA domain